MIKMRTISDQKTGGYQPNDFFDNPINGSGAFLEEGFGRVKIELHMGVVIVILTTYRSPPCPNPYGPKTYANAIGGANKFQYIVGNGGTKFRGNLHSDQMGAHKAARSVTRTIALATSAFNARSSPRMNGRCSSLTAARPLSLSFIMSR